MLACKRFLLPDAVPEAMIDNNGICSFCRDYGKIDGSAKEVGRKEREIDLEKAIKDCKGKGPASALAEVFSGKANEKCEKAMVLFGFQREVFS